MDRLIRRNVEVQFMAVTSNEHTDFPDLRVRNAESDPSHPLVECREQQATLLAFRHQNCHPLQKLDHSLTIIKFKVDLFSPPEQLTTELPAACQALLKRLECLFSLVSPYHSV